ncbi:hypothetical protein U9M48_007731 [Paspalum notatum var. saurae]|uniref:GAG-pre-integrase domain-containing protein n=1 Tax=Paspalum notatum var. saurae TaxID=547442 RepID=A0AAQ3SN31_PASNO
MWKRRLGLRTLKEVRATRLPIRFESRNQGKGKGKFKPNKTTNFKKKKNKAELPRFTCDHKRLLRLDGERVRRFVLGTVYFGKDRALEERAHVPSMNKNLVSGSLLLRDGFKVVLESNKVIVSRHGLFIGKGYVSGGLFRLSLSHFSNKCVNHICGGVNDDASLWHGRLCHVNFGLMKRLSKHEFNSEFHFCQRF